MWIHWAWRIRAFLRILNSQQTFLDEPSQTERSQLPTQVLLRVHYCLLSPSEKSVCVYVVGLVRFLYRENPSFGLPNLINEQRESE